MPAPRGTLTHRPVATDRPSVVVPTRFRTLTAPTAPRNFSPGREERYVRFVIETSDAPDLEGLRRRVDRALVTDLAETFPELVWFDEDIWGTNESWRRTGRRSRTGILDTDAVRSRLERARRGRRTRLPFELEPLFEGADRAHERFGLDRFVLLTFPVFERALDRRMHKRRGGYYDVAYVLREATGAVNVSPDNRYPNYMPLSVGEFWSCKTPPTDRAWHLENVNARTLPAGVDGSGYTIGHPDTGWTQHPQNEFGSPADPDAASDTLDSPRFDLSRDWNVLAETDDAHEPIRAGDVDGNPYHGTATASLMVSRRETLDPTAQDDDDVFGLAPGASVVPIRCVESVVLVGAVDVARAIWYATRTGVDVISMSLGGYPVAYVEAALANAVYSDLIVVAAAGNIYPFVVYPAGYPECIAVAASNEADQPWAFSARGPGVTITAPGECVYVADWTSDREPFSPPGNGTSFATAILAGAATLWLQRHDGADLVDELDGRATLQELFIEHLQRTARPWNDPVKEALYGPGILDVGALLDPNTLPDTGSFTGRDWNNWTRRSALDLLYEMFEDTDPVVVRREAEQVLGTEDDEEFDEAIDRYGEELLALLLGVPAAFESFAEAVEAEASGAAQDAADAVEEFVDEVTDTVSDTLGTVAGWFS